jgi:hypothetical protein
VALEIFLSDAAGFTGGDINNRPTAADEINSYSGGSAAEISGFATSVAARLHVAQSSDGQVLRIWAFEATETLGFLELQRPREAASLWTQPWVHNNSWYKYNTGVEPEQMSYAKLAVRGATTFVRGYPGGAAANLYLTSEAIGISSAEVFIGLHETFVQDLEPDDCFSATPIGLYSNTVGSRGRIGELVDMWWVPQLLSSGDHLDGAVAGDIAFVIVDDVLIPWEGVTAGKMKTI